jgi:hypothetical protein
MSKPFYASLTMDHDQKLFVIFGYVSLGFLAMLAWHFGIWEPAI